MIGFLIPIRLNFGRAFFTIPQRESVTPVVTGGVITKVEPAGSGISIDLLPILLLTVYLLGVVTYLLISFVRFSRWKRTVLRLSVSDKRYDAILRSATEDMGIGSVDLRFSGVISSPMMIGLRTPTILLPVREYGYDELRLILKHEMMHFIHKDLWIKLLLIICRAVHWFNPFMVLFARAIEQECEYYCDMSVMEDEPETMKKIYCTSIVNTLADQVRKSTREARPVLATSFYSPKSGLKHRFTMILGGKKRMLVGILVLTGLLTVVSGFVFAGKSTSDTVSDGSKLSRTGTAVSSEEWEEVTTWTEPDEVEETTWMQQDEVEETRVEQPGEIESSQYYNGDDEWVPETEWEETTDA